MLRAIPLRIPILLFDVEKGFIRNIAIGYHQAAQITEGRDPGKCYLSGTPDCPRVVTDRVRVAKLRAAGQVAERDCGRDAAHQDHGGQNRARDRGVGLNFKQAPSSYQTKSGFRSPASGKTVQTLRWDLARATAGTISMSRSFSGEVVDDSARALIRASSSCVQVICIFASPPDWQA